LVTKSNGVRHEPQKPLTRPGRPAAARPTGFPQLEQNRSSSGTSPSAASMRASVMTALEGSPIGVGGTSTRPAPMRVREERDRLEEPVRREPWEPPCDAVRALAEGGAAGTEATLRPCAALAGAGRGPPATGAVGALRGAAGATPPGGAATMVGTVPLGAPPAGTALAGEPQVSQ
jgi:hypothetical protein